MDVLPGILPANTDFLIQNLFRIFGKRITYIEQSINSICLWPITELQDLLQKTLVRQATAERGECRFKTREERTGEAISLSLTLILITAYPAISLWSRFSFLQASFGSLWRRQPGKEHQRARCGQTGFHSFLGGKKNEKRPRHFYTL